MTGTAMSATMPRRLLVVGGAGYLGSVTTAVLLEAGYRVTVLDDLSTGHADAVPEDAEFVEESVDSAGKILDPSYYGVLHFAAKSLVGESVARPREYWHNNVGGSLALLDAMADHGVSRLVFSSSAGVFGEPDRVPIPVEAPVRPQSPYGASKLAVEQAIAGYATAYELGAVSLRYFNAAGAYGRFGERHAIETHLIPNVLDAARTGRSVNVNGTDYPTPDGSAVRDYVHVLDLADAHLRALDAAIGGTHRVYNLGSGTGSSVLEVIAMIEEVTGLEVATTRGPRRAGDPSTLIADHTLATAELGWRPTRSLRHMIADAWAHRQTLPPPD